MTIKELAEVAGVSSETIRRTGKAFFPGMSTKGIKTIYTEKQSERIISEVKKKNLVSLNKQPTQNVDVPTQNVELVSTMIDFMAKMQEQQQQFMSAVLNRIEPKPKKQLALPESPKIKPRALLRQLVNDYTNAVNISHQEAWNELYKQFYYRCNENIKLKAKNLKIIPLDYLEQENKLLTACSIMKDLIND